jgi:hypothetical protein
MNQVMVESMLGSIVVKVELGGLIGVVVVLSTRSFPEPEEAHLLAYAEGEHDSLETRRVVEERAIVGTRPFAGMMMNLMMPMSIGFTMPMRVGFTMPMSIGFTMPMRIGFTMPMSIGFSIPTSIGFSIPTSIGFSIPTSTGFSIPTSTGFSIPVSVGFSIPMSVGFIIPVSLGFILPMSVRFTMPMSIGFTMPMSIGFTMLMSIGFIIPTSIGFIIPVSIRFSMPTSIGFSIPTSIGFIIPTSIGFITMSIGFILPISIVGIHEVPDRVVLRDPGAEGIEARIGDHDRGAALEHRRAVDHIHEVNQLADVEDDGDVGAVRAAGAAVAAARAALQDVAVDEGDGGLRSDTGFEARGDGVVEAEDRFVAVDQSAIALRLLAEQDAAVPDDGAGGVAMAWISDDASMAPVDVVPVDGALDRPEEGVQNMVMMMMMMMLAMAVLLLLPLHPIVHHCPELGPKPLVLRPELDLRSNACGFHGFQIPMPWILPRTVLRFGP